VKPSGRLLRYIQVTGSHSVTEVRARGGAGVHSAAEAGRGVGAVD